MSKLTDLSVATDKLELVVRALVNKIGSMKEGINSDIKLDDASLAVNECVKKLDPIVSSLA